MGEGSPEDGGGPDDGKAHVSLQQAQALAAKLDASEHSEVGTAIAALEQSTTDPPQVPSPKNPGVNS